MNARSTREKSKIPEHHPQKAPEKGAQNAATQSEYSIACVTYQPHFLYEGKHAYRETGTASLAP